MSAPRPTVLKYSGHEHLRTRLAMSLLSGKPLRVDNIRPDDKNPGLRDYEASLLRLLEKLSNGTVIEISYTGTAFLLKPGVLNGGRVEHDCATSRAVGYYLEPILMLAPFCKKPLELTLRGVTSDALDLSVDTIRTVSLPHLQLFGVSDGLEFKIKKRGAPPLGGGEVQLFCPVVKQVTSLNFVDPGRIKRIRGIAHAVRVSPQFSSRMIDAARGLLNRYVPDLYLYSDVYKGDESGKSPGYGLTLLAESTTGALYGAEALSEPGLPPEDVAQNAARALLSDVRAGGCIDRAHQSMVLVLMVLGSEDIARARMGPLSPRAIQTLRDIRDFWGTSFKVVPVDGDDGDGQLLLSCFGVGFLNSNRTLA
ncbi:18S rRNA biogenesis protein [Exidia glandulosa HHB12029]|uniref:18S rRNA biogenesis protein n=1 Tax=Exidia glandulosa HHB12029 TaxID=1314781 RepID=A0A165DMQ1_EXIGL|nr:18S rRNA biogenesis protein [Exidia glandulosa HHB12029]